MLRKTSMHNSETEKNPTPYDIEDKVESFHWWFSGRRKLLRYLLLSTNINFKERAIDLGCSIGLNLRMISDFEIQAIGLDFSRYALSLAKSRLNLPLINGDLNQLPIRPKSIGLVIAMDILEHLDDDKNGIHEIYLALKEGGILILTVPAFKFLSGVQDVVAGHKRRYSRREIVIKLQHEGFEIVRFSYFNFLLFFPILIARRMIRLLGLKIRSENEVNCPLINFFLKAIFSFEIHALKLLSFPFGVSIFCIAKK
jgi:SAM-dependent methyltransferase